MSRQISYEELGQLDIFNTPYKIWFKGIVSMPNIKLYIIETHGKMYGLETDDDWEKLLIHENINSDSNLNFFNKNASACFSCNEELIISNYEDPFESNIFNIEVEGYLFRTRSFKSKYDIPIYEINHASVKYFLNHINPNFTPKEESLDDILESVRSLADKYPEITKYKFMDTINSILK